MSSVCIYTAESRQHKEEPGLVSFQCWILLQFLLADDSLLSEAFVEPRDRSESVQQIVMVMMVRNY